MTRVYAGTPDSAHLRANIFGQLDRLPHRFAVTIDIDIERDRDRVAMRGLQVVREVFACELTLDSLSLSKTYFDRLSSREIRQDLGIRMALNKTGGVVRRYDTCHRPPEDRPVPLARGAV